MTTQERKDGLKAISECEKQIVLLRQIILNEPQKTELCNKFIALNQKIIKQAKIILKQD